MSPFGQKPAFAECRELVLSSDDVARTSPASKSNQVGAKLLPVTFFSFFAARFSFIVLAGFFFCSFFLSSPLLMSFSLVGWRRPGKSDAAVHHRCVY